VFTLLGRSTVSELNLAKFSHMRRLEKLKLRAVSGLTLTDDCSNLTNVEGFIHLKALVSAQNLTNLLCIFLFIFRPSSHILSKILFIVLTESIQYNLRTSKELLF